MNYLTEKQLKEIADKEVRTIEMLRDAAIDRRKNYDDKTFIDQFLEEQWRIVLKKAACIANARASLRERFINKDVVALIKTEDKGTTDFKVKLCSDDIFVNNLAEQMVKELSKGKL